ncbi:MAG: hydrogenase formation protein HypD [Desulfotalea sp.]
MSQTLPTSEELLQELHRITVKPIRLMVVCGTHNRAILRFGIRELLPEFIDLVAGPGCSVCVMPTGHIDAFVRVARQPDVITATCEDLLRVPGSSESLDDVRKEGKKVELISTAREALEIAYQQKDHIVVYPAVGFEASAPSVAEVILEAAQNGVDNFCVIPSIRLLPPTIDTLLHDPKLNIQGLLCSDHLKNISDKDAYSDLARKHNLSCCITGFEKQEILYGILKMVGQVQCGQSVIDNSGNLLYSTEETAKAHDMVSEVFFVTETSWRGLGEIAKSGFVIRDELSLYDATKRFNIRFGEGEEKCLCHCNEIISGRALPPDCPAFGMACTIQSPVGPCMISDEGICAAYFKYNLEFPKFARID